MHSEVNPFSTLGHDELIDKLQSTPDGLTIHEAQKRLIKDGPNKLTEKKKKSPIIIFLSQFSNWLMIALLVAATLSFFLGEKINASVIIGLVLLSGVFGFLQEFKSEKTQEKLSKFMSHKSRVKRDGNWEEVDTKNLVTGDLVELRIGDIAPADIALIQVDSLATNESTLTGESKPIYKSTTPHTGSQPQELKNIAFAGTIITNGIGKGYVVSTGKDTFFGKTAALISKQAPSTEFQRQTKNFSVFLFKTVVFLTIFVFMTNSLLGRGVLDSFLFAVALAVGIAPELLPAIITITLSQGALKLAKKKVIVKRLMSIEDLGNIDVLCTDKTGTLTEGAFKLVDYKTLDGDKLDSLVVKAMLCASGSLEHNKTLTTNAIDKALWESSIANKLKSKLSSFELLDENEFDYERRRVSALIKEHNKNILLVKGSIESLIDVCKLEKDKRKKIEQKAKQYEEKGYRVIGIAEKELEKKKSSKNDETGLSFTGFLLFSDPVKSTAADAIARLKEMGVNIKILSGDSSIVTAEIASQVGFDANSENLVTGDDLEKMTPTQLIKCVQSTNIFARVTPEQKYKIVQALSKEGHVVGFLGDGVNDAAALKAADVGITVDSATAVAKEASDIILLKKDLHVLAEGIATGRKTFGNIMKYILNTISANFGNMFTVSASSLFLTFIPLLPSQILLNNFISDIPLFAVATDNVDEEFVKKPKRWDIKTIRNFLLYFGPISTLFDLITILPLAFIWHVPIDVFRTAWFVESSLSEMLVTFSIRTKLPFYKSKPSKVLIWLSTASSLVVIILPMLPFGEKFFGFSQMPAFVWGWVGLTTILYVLATEIAKHIFFRHFDL